MLRLNTCVKSLTKNSYNLWIKIIFKNEIALDYTIFQRDSYKQDFSSFFCETGQISKMDKMSQGHWYRIQMLIKS